MRTLVRQDAKGRVHALDVVISDEGRGAIPLRGHGSDRARAPLRTQLRRRVGRPWGFIELGGSGVGGRILEDRYGACPSIRCWSWWKDELDKQLSEVNGFMEKLRDAIGVGFEGWVLKDRYEQVMGRVEGAQEQMRSALDEEKRRLRFIGILMICMRSVGDRKILRSSWCIPSHEEVLCYYQ